MKKELIESIKQQMKDIEKENNKSYVYLNDPKVVDYSIKYDIKNKYLFVSLSLEDIENINIDNVANYEDITIINLKNIKKYSLNDLDLINDMLFLASGDRW